MNELFERELQNTSINDVSLADYVKENYVPMSVIEDIKADIKAEMRDYDGDNDFTMGIMYGLRYANTIIDKHTIEGCGVWIRY